MSWKHKPTLGYLNLVSDFLHNIMDGLAIGILFASSEENNFRDTAATMIAIVIHEIAQEIGDTSHDLFYLEDLKLREQTYFL